MTKQQKQPSTIMNGRPPQLGEEQAELPSNVLKNLPHSACYSGEDLVSDLTAMFEGKTRKPVKAVNANWQSNNAGSRFHEFSDNVTKQAIRYSKFYSSFPRTPMFKAMKQSGMTPREMTEKLIESINLPNMDLPEIGKQANNLPCLLGDQPPSQILWKIAPLIDKLKLQDQRYESRDSEDRQRSSIPAEDLDIVPLRDFSLSNLMKITTQDQLAPDDEYFDRLIHRKVTQYEYISVTTVPAPPKNIEMLIDVSGSMMDGMKNGKNTRADYAIASAVCLLQSVLKGNHNLTIRSFDSQVYPPIHCDSPKEAIQKLLDLTFTGGNTKIDKALAQAQADHAHEVILITDGEDTVSSHPPFSLVTYQCMASLIDKNRDLERISTEYYPVM